MVPVLLIAIILLYLMVPFKSIRNLVIVVMVGLLSFILLRSTIYALPIIAIAVITLLISRKKFWHSLKHFSTPKLVKQEKKMSKSDASAILGIRENASEEEIKLAYHQLINKCHPDHGGSDYLASKINQAKEVLLNKKA